MRTGGGGGPVPVLNRNVRVLFIGDSTTAGIGADPTGVTDYVGSRAFSAPIKARDWLAANGVTAISESVAGDNSVGVYTEWNQYRPDITIVGAPPLSSRSPTAGGTLVRLAGVDAVEFTTTIPVDTVRFGIPRASGFGVLRFLIDDVEHSTYNESVTPEDYFFTTVTGLVLSTHKFSFQRVSGTPHSAGLIEAWDSSTPSVQIINAGARGSKTSDWVKNTYPINPLGAVGFMLPDIAVIDLGINDYRQSGTTIATAKDNIQTVINRLVSVGAKVVLAVPNSIVSYNTVTDAWSQAAVLTMYQELAAANAGSVLLNMPQAYAEAGLGVDNPATWGSLNAAGHMYDSFHPKASVYAVEGAVLGAAIKSICISEGWVA